MKSVLYSTLAYAFFLLTTIDSYSQNTNASTPRIAVSEVTIMGGVMSLPSYGNTITMFKTLAPNSDILAGDLSKYSNSFEPTNHALGVFNTYVSLQFNGKDGAEKRNPLLRLGITYQGGQRLTKNLKFETRTPYDTLVSSQTGTNTYIDSIYTSTIEMRYRTSQVLADVAVIWRTNPEFLWSLYGGLGFAGGISLDNRTTVTRTESNNTSNGRGNYYPNEGNNEIIKNDNGYSALAYLPLGVGVGMGRTGFWKTLLFVIEMRPGISIMSIPELETNVTAVFPVSFGWKVSW
ncbi:hypothetical protein G3O08_16135 [Cryomorpha ignava]|uniref:Outer membrane beta-barrel protein n=1 Tax=Cryomorpha ignava TaxID=101383 RepID=A0A7K3WVG0_9FLAO|nr:hypothetical protein [Cryomorpha ignava]NEN25031.1 hypothetical protein [Cryomorpha ignava]